MKRLSHRFHFVQTTIGRPQRNCDGCFPFFTPLNQVSQKLASLVVQHGLCPKSPMGVMYPGVHRAGRGEPWGTFLPLGAPHRSTLSRLRIVVALSSQPPVFVDSGGCCSGLCDIADVRQRKADLFGASLNVSLAVAAPLHVGDPQQCPLCRADFAAGDAERLTLACCDHKQSICRRCFVRSAFESSNEATKTFAHCPD
jgi:hypothetical protein